MDNPIGNSKAKMVYRTPSLSVVLGSFNRRRLLMETIRSVRENGFKGMIEMIVIDGGSSDGTCEWLAKQKDILTLLQPNYRISLTDGSTRRAHTWGEFMNLGFRQARAPWVLMVSDDLLLCPGAIQNGLNQLNELQRNGLKIGGGALFWREYPCDVKYHVKVMPGDFVHVNHGFFWKRALEDVGYADEERFEFYGADGDLTMRLNLAGWRTVSLDDSFAEHLNHPIRLSRLLGALSHCSAGRDMELFYRRYKYFRQSKETIEKAWKDTKNIGRRFWWIDPGACLQSVTRKIFQI